MSEENKIKLYQKIHAVMCEAPSLEKDTNVGTGKNSYKAISEKVVLNSLKPLFVKHKLICIPVDGEINEILEPYVITDYNGKDAKKVKALTQLKVNYKIIDIETGEHEILVGFGNGFDSMDKGAGKAFTYNYKGMLCKTFMTFSGDDTDNNHSDDLEKELKTNNSLPPVPPTPKQMKIISDKILNLINTYEPTQKDKGLNWFENATNQEKIDMYNKNKQKADSV